MPHPILSASAEIPYFVDQAQLEEALATRFAELRSVRALNIAGRLYDIAAGGCVHERRPVAGS